MYCMSCMELLDATGSCRRCGTAGSKPNASHQLPKGMLLGGRYLIGRVLGQGGFGITYIARDQVLGIRVAVKEFYPTGFANRNTDLTCKVTVTEDGRSIFLENGKHKFLDEARVLGEFCGVPGVVEVRDYFEANNTAYIVMEYLDGEDLRSRLKKGLLSADQAFALAVPIMGALERIHAKGVVHRDISPDNIMILRDGTLRLMDFGTARFVDYSDQRSVSIMLKAGYAPEEQYRAKGEQGPWTDIYALCATIYKSITGKTPDDSLQRLYRDEMKWPSELGVPITPVQEAALKWGMSPRAEDRFHSIGEMWRFLNQPDAQEAPTRVVHRAGADDASAERPGKRRGLRKAAAVAAACVLAAVLAGAWAFHPQLAQLVTPVYTVEFDTGDAGSVASVEVPGGDYLEEPEAPALENHVFTGWYFDDGLQQKAEFPLQVASNITLRAGWEEVLVGYRVRYLNKVSREAVADDKLVPGNTVGSTVAEAAPQINGYKVTGKKEREITLQADEAENVITFKYLRVVGYTVRYVDQATGQSITPDKAVSDKLETEEVVEAAPSPDGYVLQSDSEQALTLGADTAENVITFNYAVYQAPVSYSYEGGGSSGGGSSGGGGGSGKKIDWAN